MILRPIVHFSHPNVTDVKQPHILKLVDVELYIHSQNFNVPNQLHVVTNFVALHPAVHCRLCFHEFVFSPIMNVLFIVVSHFASVFVIMLLFFIWGFIKPENLKAK
jgi:hypothetical protein